MLPCIDCPQLRADNLSVHLCVPRRTLGSERCDATAVSQERDHCEFPYNGLILGHAHFLVPGGRANNLRLPPAYIPSIDPTFAQDRGEVRPRTATGVAAHDPQTVYCGWCPRMSCLFFFDERPSHHEHFQGLQETVACMCATVHHLTHDFARLVALLRSCNGAFSAADVIYRSDICSLCPARLQQSISKPVTSALVPAEQRTLSILLFITSLLCEHCNFDRLRMEEESKSEPFAVEPSLMGENRVQRGHR